MDFSSITALVRVSGMVYPIGTLTNTREGLAPGTGTGNSVTAVSEMNPATSLPWGNADLSNTTNLSGLFWELPCTGGIVYQIACPCSNGNTTETTASLPSGIYTAVVRIRGIMEQKSYVGGSLDGEWYSGGTPVSDTYNSYRLTVTSPTIGFQEFYVNPGVSGKSYVNVWDYVQTLSIENGSVLQFETDSGGDGLEISNGYPASPPYPDQPPQSVLDDDPSHPVLVSQPYNGQFCQLDILTIFS